MGMVFARPGDNLLADASLTLSSGTALSGYGLANLYNQTWAHPLKISETELDLRIDLGAADLPEWVVLGNSNVDVAAKFQGHTSDSWGTPDIDLTFGVPTQSVDGLFTSPHLNLSALAAKRYWRLFITGNALPIIIGELLLASTRRTISREHLLQDIALGSIGRSVEHETPFGVDLAYQQASRRDVLDGSIIVGATDYTALEGLVQATRMGVRPFFYVHRHDSADAWMVKYAGSGLLGRRPLDAHLARVPFPIRQLSRGLPWVDPDA